MSWRRVQEHRDFVFRKPGWPFQTDSLSCRRVALSVKTTLPTSQEPCGLACKLHC